jgi:hypothetical protein
VLRAAGVADTPEQARAYLAHVAEGFRPRAGGAARVRPGDARPGPGENARPVRVGARLRRLLPRGTRRAVRGAQYRARSA